MHTRAARPSPARRRSSAAPATPARTASSCCSTPSDARRRSGTRCSPRARRPAGLGARDTLRLEVCFHLYGNDLTQERNPIEAGPGLVLQGGHGLHRRRGRRAPRASRPAREARRRSRSTGPASRARATRCVGRRRGRPAARSRPCLERRDRHGLRARRARRAGHRARDRRARQASAPPWSSAKPLYRKGELTSGRRAATPTTCSTTPSTTGPGSTATSATFGITWYAQDALGEVVFFDPPEVGTHGRPRTSPTPRSSRSRPSPT